MKQLAKYIPKSTPIFVQNDFEKNLFKSQGFSKITIVGMNTSFNGITISKNEGRHGTDDVIKHFREDFAFGKGFVLRAEGEKTVYFTVDTIWTKNYEMGIEIYKPDYIVMNAALPLCDGIEGSSIMGQKM